MRAVFLTIGTILAILFIFHLTRGAKYVSMVENLPSDQYPFHDLYVVGFSWAKTKLLAFRGKLAAALVNHAALLHGKLYAQYYGNLAWAQALTLGHLGLMVTFLAAGTMYSYRVIFMLGGILTTVIFIVYPLENMKNKLKERTQKCEDELAQAVSTMAVLVNSGMLLQDAWERIGNHGKGAIYELMRNASLNMNNGMPIASAIYLFGRESDSFEVKKFASAMVQSIEKSGHGLPTFLANQSTEIWNRHKQVMLQRGEKASLKLLAPTVLVFIGVIIIVIAAAFGGALF